MTTDNKALIAEAADLAKVWRARGPAVDLAHRTLALIDSVAALEAAQLPTRPDRDTLANKLDEALSHTYVPFPELVEAADALLAAPDLWQPAPEVDEAERMRGVLDRHLPTIITGLSQVVSGNGRGIGYKSREERTDNDIAIMAALSAAHWIAKEIASGRGEPLYDLPSVLDLLSVNRRIQADRTANNPYDRRSRTVSTVEELDALPVESVVRVEKVRFGDSRIYRKINSTSWVTDMFVGYSGPVPLPATVLFVPSEGMES